MCKVSNNIKFCTCATSDPYRLKHYWILHRYVGNKDSFMLGEPMMDFAIGKEMQVHNENILLKRINEVDAFDVPMGFQETDRLLISFTCSGDSNERVNYRFEYLNGRWVSATFDVFDLMNHFEEIFFGKIKHPLERK